MLAWKTTTYLKHHWHLFERTNDIFLTKKEEEVIYREFTWASNASERKQFRIFQDHQNNGLTYVDRPQASGICRFH